MRQDTSLNRSRTPERRGQTHPGRSNAQDADDLATGLKRKANATRVGGLHTALNAAVDRIQELEARVAALEAGAIQPPAST